MWGNIEMNFKTIDFMKKQTDILLFLIICLIFIIFTFKEVYRIPGLYSYDPYYHIFISKLIISTGEIVSKIPTYDGYINLNYFTFLCPITAILNLISGIPLLDIYKTFGIFSRIIIVLVLYSTMKLFLFPKKVVVFITILFLSVPYVIYRSFITYPENMVIIFILLSFNSVFKSLKNEKLDIFLPLWITASVFYHPKMAVISILFSIYLMIYFLRKQKYKDILKFIIPVVVLTFPVILKCLEVVQGLIIYNVGESAKFIPHTIGDPRYSIPTSDYYLSLGFILIILFFFGFICLFKDRDMMKFLLLLWLIFAFVLTRGVQFHLYLPIDRMLIHLILPFLLIAGLGLNQLNKKGILEKRNIVLLLTIVIITTFISNLYMEKGWVGISDDARLTGNWLENNVDQNSVVISICESRHTNVINMGFGRPELFDPNALGKLQEYKDIAFGLEQLYPDKKVFLISNEFLSYEELEIVHKEGNIITYKFSPGETIV